jgi:hypothetical protein
MFIHLLLSLAIKSCLRINELQHLFMKREIYFGYVTHNCINNLDTPITWHYMILYFMVTVERTLDTTHVPLLAIGWPSWKNLYQSQYQKYHIQLWTWKNLSVLMSFPTSKLQIPAMLQDSNENHNFSNIFVNGLAMMPKSLTKLFVTAFNVFGFCHFLLLLLK